MSFKPPDTQRTHLKILSDDYILTWVEAFLVDRTVQNVSKGTLKFYRAKLRLFTEFCDARVIKQISQVTPNELRQFLLHLEETGHNAGGVHAAYRSVKAFLRWYEDEAEPEGWKNPIRKVKSPKVPIEPLDPVGLADVDAMADGCPRDTFTGDRDRAILLCLLDTGARAQELLDINLTDVNLVLGEILIRQGKGRKPRSVFLGNRSRRALRKYLKRRDDNLEALWIRDDRLGRLKYGGLRYIIIRRAIDAGIKPPSPHDFRRSFALESWRNGLDLHTIAKMMGHTSLQVLNRYIKPTDGDVRERYISPVDDK